MSLRKTIENYIPSDEREEKDKEQMLKFIDSFDDVLTRNNIFGHFSASAFIVNKERTKFVGVYHIINDGWTYPGGHADGEEDLLKVAYREAFEETGLKVKILKEDPILLSSNAVDVHIKNGHYVSAHLHLDLLYLMEADENLPLKYSENESKGVKWIAFDDLEKEKMVEFTRPIIRKIKEKI